MMNDECDLPNWLKEAERRFRAQIKIMAGPKGQTPIFHFHSFLVGKKTLTQQATFVCYLLVGTISPFCVLDEVE